MTAERIAVVLGTRPEAIKLFVLIELLSDRALIIHTGQHFDDELVPGVAADLDLRAPDIQLSLGGTPRGVQIGQVTDVLTRLFAGNRPAAVVVQGDTNSALGGALAANAEAIPLVHVEAGLRSHDRAMPEEHNRILIDHLADMCAAPTERAASALADEGIAADRIAVTGNTIVEAVQRMTPGGTHRAQIRRHYIGLSDEPFVLATLHRPENVDATQPLRAALEALAALPVPVVFPMHPRTAARVHEFGLEAVAAELRVIPPVPPSDFLGLFQEAVVLVSDSGGVQEEASILKRPVLVVRRSTERPEALGSFAELIGADEIVDRCARYLRTDGSCRDLQLLPCPFGDGKASDRIAELTLGLAQAAVASW